MEKLTLGQVMDTLKLGQVALKVNGKSGETGFNDLVYLEDGFHFDENDHNILKTVRNTEISFCHNPNADESDREYYVIIEKEDYYKVFKDNNKEE